jgi:hypothetical protein
MGSPLLVKLEINDANDEFDAEIHDGTGGS